MKKILALLVLVLLAGCATTDYYPRPYITPSHKPVAKPMLIPRGLPEPIAELIVICHPRQYECQEFLKEVPFDYDEHVQAYILPMREVNITYEVSSLWYRTAYRQGRLYEMARTMPTFIVWQGDRDTGHELARWEGYEDMESFLGQVDLMIEMYDLKQW